MHHTTKTRIQPFNSIVTTHDSQHRRALNNQNSIEKPKTSKAKYFTAIIVCGALLFGLCAVAIIVPVAYHLNASKNEVTSTVSTATGTTVTVTTVTTETTTTTTVTTTSTTVTTTTVPSLQWNITGITIAGSSVGSSGITSSLLSIPACLVLDSSNAVYITDYNNNRVQKWVIGASSGTTVAGQANGASGASSTSINNAVGIVLDSSNNMYFSDQRNHRVMYWANGASSGTVVAGVTGSLGSANNQLYYPAGLDRVATNGTLYIADLYNHRIMRYLSGASSGTVVAGGNGVGTGSTQLNYPQSVIFDSTSNSLIIGNYGAHNVLRWVLGASSWTLLAGSASGASGSTSTLLNNPLGVAIDPYGNIYVADIRNHRIQLFLSGQSNGTTIAGITGSPGTAANQLDTPYWVTLDSQLNLYVADSNNNRVQKFSRS